MLQTLIMVLNSQLFFYFLPFTFFVSVPFWLHHFLSLLSRSKADELWAYISDSRCLGNQNRYPDSDDKHL